jgi:hypothetical protein
MGSAASKSPAETTSAAAEDGYQLLSDIPDIPGTQRSNNLADMNTKNETSSSEQPPVYGDVEIIKIDDAIEAIGMGK